MHKHRREHRQIYRRRALGEIQSALHLASYVAPLRDLGGNHAVPQCEFGVGYLIQIDRHVDRDQRVAYKRNRPPLRIVVTNRKEEHHFSSWGVGSGERKISIYLRSPLPTPAQRVPHFNFVLKTSK